MSAATDQNIRKQVGHRIKVRRTELALTQQGLADRIGLKQAHISAWELGTRSIQVDQLVRLAKVLDVTVGHLVGEESRTV